MSTFKNHRRDNNNNTGLQKKIHAFFIRVSVSDILWVIEHESDDQNALSRWVFV